MRPSAHSLSQGSREKGCLHPPSLGKRPPPSSSPCRGPGGCSAAESAHVTGSSSSDQLQLCSKTSTISSVAGCRSLPPLPTAPSTLPAVLAEHSPAAPHVPSEHPRSRCWAQGTHLDGRRGLCLWDPASPACAGWSGTAGGPVPGLRRAQSAGLRTRSTAGHAGAPCRGWGRERGLGAHRAAHLGLGPVLQEVLQVEVGKRRPHAAAAAAGAAPRLEGHGGGSCGRSRWPRQR